MDGFAVSPVTVRGPKMGSNVGAKRGGGRRSEAGGGGGARRGEAGQDLARRTDESKVTEGEVKRNAVRRCELGYVPETGWRVAGGDGRSGAPPGSDSSRNRSP